MRSPNSPAAPFLLNEHCSTQSIKLFVQKLCDCTGEILWQNMPRHGGCGVHNL